MTTSTLSDELSRLIGATTRSVDGLLECIDWAEDEIDQAMTRHPGQADTLFHAFSLLKVTNDRMAHERVFRSHCRELLDRVAAGEDTRPATAAEICCACSTVSKIVPLSSAAAGLYFRMWPQAFPDLPNPGANVQHHREALDRSKIDDLEADTRRKLTVSDRRLGDITCSGRHHSETVDCRYATSTMGRRRVPTSKSGRPGH